ncbi:MAG: response regulator [Bacteroidales bacterium]|nr:response regulator [Bacteroidales bacterium]
MMKHILVVDDNLMMRKLIRNLFHNDNYIIEEATNGVEGLEIVKQHPVDLIITDIIMPKMEGIEMIMNLRRDFPDIKIIAISGGKPYYLYMAKKLGIDGIFTKPLNHDAFLKAVKKVIQFPGKEQIQAE